MGERQRAGISFWIGGGAGGLAEAAPPHPTAPRPPSPTRGEGRSAGLRPFAYAPGVRTSNRSTGAICPDGTVLTPRVKPEDDEGEARGGGSGEAGRSVAFAEQLFE